MQGWDRRSASWAGMCSSLPKRNESKMNKHPGHLTASLDGLIDSRTLPGSRELLNPCPRRFRLWPFAENVGILETRTRHALWGRRGVELRDSQQVRPDVGRK